MSDYTYDDDYDGYYGPPEDDEYVECDECGNAIPFGRMVDPGHAKSCSLYPHPVNALEPSKPHTVSGYAKEVADAILAQKKTVTPKPSTPKPSKPKPSTRDLWKGMVTLKADDEFFFVYFADDSRYVTVYGNGKMEVKVRKSRDGQ